VETILELSSLALKLVLGDVDAVEAVRYTLGKQYTRHGLGRHSLGVVNPQLRARIALLLIVYHYHQVTVVIP
jgi:hypothetical protein